LSDEQLDLDRYIPFGLTAIANKASRGASRIYLDLFGIGINEWRILANLKIRPGMSANTICAESGLDKAAVSRSLRSLEEAGRVTADDGSEARGRQLRLTASGEALHDQVIRVALHRENLLLDGFTKQERRQLYAFIRRLRVNVEAANNIDYRELPAEALDVNGAYTPAVEVEKAES